jgi:dTDP-4-dehydrorhamnose reductase
LLVTGAGGLVGRALVQHCTARGDEVIAHDHASLDISVDSLVITALERGRPEAVINCAAWTDVDGCELDPQRAFAANALGPANLASACSHIGASLVTISTDYVFDGAKKGFYTQRDDPRPLSVYGRVKLEGERRAQNVCARTTVVRSGWIFGAGGKNFLSQVVELAERGVRLKAIRDGYGTPTFVLDLAARLRELAQLDLPGIYHVVNEGDGTSYEGFVREALRLAGCDGAMVESVTMESLHRPAPRPRNSRLRCLLSPALGLAPLPDWRASLKDFVGSGAEG